MNWKKSRCEICNTTSSCDRHHIIPQSEDGPNVKWNLVMLCAGCHRKCTTGEIIIKGKYLSSGGYIIDYMDLNTSGIYAIRNSTNDKVYVGSSVNMHRRSNQHFNDLRNNRHHNNHLQNAWNKYGENSFDFEVLEYVEENQLIEKEKIWLDEFPKECFNLMEVVEKDFRHSIETKEKISKGNKGKIVSKETRKRLGLANKRRFARDKHPMLGKSPSIETRKKISNANKGRKRTEEARKQMSNAHKGKVLSEETKQKISEALKNRFFSEETRKRLGLANKRRSEETRKKISQKLKGHRHTEETKKKIGEASRNRMYRNNLQLFLF